MGRITHVCLSDVHAGAAASLATRVDDALAVHPAAPSPTSAAFGTAMQDLLTRHNQDQFGAPYAGAHKPMAILMGDLLDLAFCNRADAAVSYCSWFSAITGGGNDWFADDAVMLPGNHDHSLWTAARFADEARAAETGQVEGLLAATKAAQPALADGLRGSATASGILAPMITALNRRCGLPGTVTINYPNFALVSDDHARAVVFHHGHFVDATYTMMSRLVDVLTGKRRRHSAQALADENANWIDFGWSSFGEASDLCKIVNDLYTGAENGAEARQLRDRAAKLIERAIVAKLPMGGDTTLQTWIERGVLAGLDTTLGAWSDSERYSKTLYLSPDGLTGLTTYLDGAVKPQLVEELGAVPPDLTFIFGHTHKPFVDQVLTAAGQSISVANTGGWYLDNTRLDSRDGAAMVLIDEDLNAVSIRYFGVPTNDIPTRVSVDLVSRPSPSATAFHDQISGYVQDGLAVWDALSETAADAYRLRQTMMFAQLDAMDAEAGQTGAIL
ncbi:hypothetical protein [Actibacterium sp. 188UL27-1]|uniref:hypothetical protein n=1 Tax=Actibacterium sp. 188UL27-1 TaxID=2786961 RepID=UPI0019589F8E|nr:hypothetical protein [Actibacterium sp. 188UL27-1]MBM7068949.1 hypothetical protein [Actibacterium sp. 188UL27-1]